MKTIEQLLEWLKAERLHTFIHYAKFEDEYSEGYTDCLDKIIKLIEEKVDAR